MATVEKMLRGKLHVVADSPHHPLGVAALARWLVLVLVAVIVLYPMAQLFILSTLERNQIMMRDANWWPPNFDAYTRAWRDAPFPRYFINSLIVSCTVTVGSTITAILAAYVFARTRFAGRDALFVLVIGTLMIPSHITLIPNYLTFARFHALDTFSALILPSLASGFSVFFLRQYMLGIPKNLDEAAFMDGASRWMILWTIIVPLCRPAIAVVALFAFLNEWNNFIWPLLATTSEEMRTVQIGLRYLFRAELESGGVDWPLIMASSTIVLVPLLLIYLVAERHLIRGIALGSSR